MPQRERYLFVCTNRRDEGTPKGSCAGKGSEALLAKLKGALVARGLHRRLRACGSGCLDLCESGAAMLQEPEHVVYGGVTLADVDDIVEALAAGGVVQRLVVPSTPTTST